jgi:hypothetical protein
LPNFIKKGEKYLRKYKEFIVGEWSMNTILFLGLDAMGNNECFYRYSDRAKLILVQDNDETFIPPKLINNFETSQRVVGFLSKNRYFKDKKSMKKFQESYLSNSFCESKPNYLSSYLENMYVKNKLEEDHSIYFPQVVFGKPDLIDLIFDRIGAINVTLNENSNITSYPIKVKIKQNYNNSEPNYQDRF